MLLQDFVKKFLKKNFFSKDVSVVSCFHLNSSPVQRCKSFMQYQAVICLGTQTNSDNRLVFFMLSVPKVICFNFARN